MLVVTCFWVFLVRNGHRLLDHGTVKYDESQE